MTRTILRRLAACSAALLMSATPLLPTPMTGPPAAQAAPAAQKSGEVYGYSYRVNDARSTFTDGARQGKFDNFSEGARIGNRDPFGIADAALGPLLRSATLDAMRQAGSRRDAFTLLLTSPEFQRR